MKSLRGRKGIHTSKWERCVKDVEQRDGSVNPKAVCTASIGYCGSIKAAHRRRKAACKG